MREKTKRNLKVSLKRERKSGVLVFLITCSRTGCYLGFIFN